MSSRVQCYVLVTELNTAGQSVCSEEHKVLNCELQFTQTTQGYSKIKI